MAFMDKYITPYAAKMGAQRHLVAVRDAFVAMIPLTIIGSLATLINNAPIKALNNFLAENTFGQQIKTLNTYYMMTQKNIKRNFFLIINF